MVAQEVSTRAYHQRELKKHKNISSRIIRLECCPYSSPKPRLKNKFFVKERNIFWLFLVVVLGTPNNVVSTRTIAAAASDCCWVYIRIHNVNGPAPYIHVNIIAFGLRNWWVISRHRSDGISIKSDTCIRELPAAQPHSPAQKKKGGRNGPGYSSTVAVLLLLLLR